MRKREIGLLALITVLGATPAWALQIPQPVKGGDPHQCTVEYNDKEVVAIQARAGENIGVRFGSDETLLAVNTSDSAHLKYSQAGKEASNIAYFKAVTDMPAQALSVRTVRPDNKPPRDYEFQWSAKGSIFSPPTELASVSVSPVGLGEAAAAEPPKSQQPECWQITFLYPGDAKAAQAAAWKAAAAKRQAQAAEVALHEQQLMSCTDSPPPVDPIHKTTAALNDSQLARRPTPNVKYVGMGDGDIAPYAICDDGMTTIMKFSGSMPTVYGVNANGTDRSIGYNVEDNGLLRIHEVPKPAVDGHYSVPVLRLRAGDQVFCIFNRAYDQNDPRTGTSVRAVFRATGGSG